MKNTLKLVTILPGSIGGPGFMRNTPTIDLIETMMKGGFRTLGTPRTASREMIGMMRGRRYNTSSRRAREVLGWRPPVEPRAKPEGQHERAAPPRRKQSSEHDSRVEDDIGVGRAFAGPNDGARRA